MRVTRRQLRELIREAIEEDDSSDKRALLRKLVSLTWSDPSHAAAMAVALGDPQLLLEFWQEWRWISDYLLWETLAIGGSTATLNPITHPTDRTDRVKMMARWLGARPKKRRGWLYDFKIGIVDLANIRPNLEGVDDWDEHGDRAWAPPPGDIEKQIEYTRARDNFINKYADTFNQYMSGKRIIDKLYMRDINSSGLLDAVLAAHKSRNDASDDMGLIDYDLPPMVELARNISYFETADILDEAKRSRHAKMKRCELRDMILQEIENTFEGKKASKSKGKPYKGSRRGKTESQAQQMAAGIALRAREKYGKKGAIKKLRGASKSMAAMTMKDLRKLATIRRGSEVPDSTKKGKERAALPGHIRKKK